jgi:hypothetical protein
MSLCACCDFGRDEPCTCTPERLCDTCEARRGLGKFVVHAEGCPKLGESRAEAVGG